MLAGLEAVRSQLADEWYERIDDLRSGLLDAADDAYQAVVRRLDGERSVLAGQRQLVLRRHPD